MIKVFQIGPDKNLKGGIATVIKQIDECDNLNNKYTISTISTTTNTNKLITYIKAIFKALNIKNKSIVHFHIASNGSFVRKYILFKMLRKDIEKIAHIHGGDFINYYKNSGKLIKYSINDMMKNSCKIISVSQYMIDELNREFPEYKNKSLKIYNGIELNEIDIDYEQKENVIVYLGKITQYKGIYDLIKSAEYCKSTLENKGWKIKIAGDGEIDLVNKIIRDNKIENIVEVIGWIEGENKVDMLKKSKVLIIPSHVESFGISAIEAMSFGNAIIATNVGALPEIIQNNVNGIIVEKGNYIEIGENIKKMIHDSEITKYMCYENVKYSKLFSKESMIKQIINLYDNLQSKI